MSEFGKFYQIYKNARVLRSRKVCNNADLYDQILTNVFMFLKTVTLAHNISTVTFRMNFFDR